MDKHLHIISRKKAKELGMSEYFTGRPCIRGGIAVRKVDRNRCTCEECMILYRAKRAKMRPKRKQKQKEYFKEYYQKNKDRIRSDVDAWQDDNSHKLRSYIAKKRAKDLNRILDCDQELTEFISQEAAELVQQRGEEFGFKWNVDHMLPLNGDVVSGFHHWSNLQVIPAALNSHKRNRMVCTEPFEWIKYMEDQCK